MSHHQHLLPFPYQYCDGPECRTDYHYITKLECCQLGANRPLALADITRATDTLDRAVTNLRFHGRTKNNKNMLDQEFFWTMLCT